MSAFHKQHSIIISLRYMYQAKQQYTTLYYDLKVIHVNSLPGGLEDLEGPFFLSLRWVLVLLYFHVVLLHPLLLVILDLRQVLVDLSLLWCPVRNREDNK
jgi:hypothetical protein